MFPFKKPINNGSPWIDYKESIKTGINLVFIFKVDDFMAFVLHNLCVTYPCRALGVSQPIMKVRAVLSSRTDEIIPVELPENLFSSPSQNYSLGTIAETQQGQRMQPVYYNIPCDYGDTIKVMISGAGTGYVVGCMLTGRKYKESGCL
jgi:hypothetical protein